MRRRSWVAVGGLVLGLALSTTASAQFSPGARSAGDPYFPAIGNGGYDAQHYDLTIAYDPGENTMVSKADITIRATQALSELSLDLRASAFPGATVAIDGVPAGVVQDADKLIVTPAAGIENGRVFHAVVDYAGTPVQVQDPDGSFEGWARISTGGFVVNEPIGAVGWFPSNNTPSDKATYAFHITVPSTHTALGNGELDSKVDNGDGTSTWNWSIAHPTATYLTTSTVGVFDYVELTGATALGRSGDALKLYNAYESALSDAQKANAATVAARQDGIVKFISDEIGAPYPYESHGVVLHRTSLGYALEVQTKSHFSGTSINATTLAHEIAHQWFGDSVGPATWREIWFNEGWATWWEWYWSNKQNGGSTTVEQRFTSNYDSTSQPTRWNTPPASLPGPQQLFSSFPVYTRPALMLEAYREIVGHSAFMAFARALATDYAYSTIDARQFVALAKAVAAERAGFEASNLAKLDLFFDQWLNGVGKPALNPTTFFLSTSVTGNVSGTVPATLSLTLGAPADFGSFTPGVARTYSASTTATVLSTAGDASLSISDPSTVAPGHLVNGTFSLAQPLNARSGDGAFAPLGASPLAVLTYTGPITNATTGIDFQQAIGASDPLRTGTYAKTLTFTLSTTNP